MFGYIKPLKDELRIKEYELYRAYYCSMCKKLGESYGIFARFTLNFEFVFLSILYASLNDKDCPTKLGRCPFNPTKKCNYCEKSDEELDFSSSAAIMLLYYKLLDNIRDEKNIKKLVFIFLKPLFKRNHKKAKEKYPELDEIFLNYDNEQQKIEQKGDMNIDAAAEPTAKMLSKLFKMCSTEENNQRVLERLGYCMGRYIYILDAAVDLEKDKKTGSYNPLKNLKNPKELAERQLYFSINEASNAFELLNVYKFKNILGNIITLGLQDTFKKELSK